MVRSIDGWISEDNVVRFLEYASRYIGYDYGEPDEVALTGALDPTDDESADGWFSYPLEGVPPLIVLLARAVGGSVVSVRVQGQFDVVLATRLETLLDLL